MALTQSVEERFWAKVDIRGVDECWPWKSWTSAPRGKAGYGRFRGYQGIDGPIRAAHRIAYQLHFAESLKGWFVCHKCDNPICCNPAHLMRGTNADNMRDIVKRNRSLETNIAYQRGYDDGLQEGEKRGWEKAIEAAAKYAASLKSYSGYARDVAAAIRKLKKP